MKSPVIILALAIALIARLAEPSRAAGAEGADNAGAPAATDMNRNGCQARSSPAEDADDLTTVPFWRLVEQVALRPALRLAVDGADAFAAEIAPLDDDMRRLVLLFALWNAMGWQGDGLPWFFESESGAIAPGVRDALRAAGLTGEFETFSRAMALFGERYPADLEARKKYFASGTPSPRLSGFDRRMLALAAQFGSRKKYSKRIVAHVMATPALWQRIEAVRQQLSETDRLRVLTTALAGRIDTWQPQAKIELSLAALSPRQRPLLVLATFNMEFWNGGVHQFFYNSSGAVAPDVHDALIALGLTRQAAIFRRALDMFPQPYVRETQRRRETTFDGVWNEWDKRLSGLTDEFYALDGGPGIEDAMVRYAREHRLLPC